MIALPEIKMGLYDSIFSEIIKYSFFKRASRSIQTYDMQITLFLSIQNLYAASLQSSVTLLKVNVYFNNFHFCPFSDLNL